MQALPGGKLPLGRHNQDPNRPRPINRVWVIKTDSWNDSVRQCKVPSDCSDSLNLCTEQLAPLIKSSDSVYLESTAFESIRHKTEVYEGLHAAIIEQEQFDRVQEQLQAKSVIKRGKHPSRGPSAYLVGKVYDETGDRLTPSRSKKSSGRVIRYYYSNRLISGGADPTGWRLRADMLEQLLSEIVGTRLRESLTQFRLAPQIKPHALVGAKERLEQLDIKGTLDLITRVDLCETKASIQLEV